MNNQEVLQLMTISFILMTLMFDSWMILKGEIRCWSLWDKRVKGSVYQVVIVVNWFHIACSYGYNDILSSLDEIWSVLTSL